jgi:ABC-type transport system involved in cytochrome c biogenesis ATPase subunit
VQAAAVLEDTAAIRRMTDDAHDNVAESAIEALHARTGHADDARYLAALRRDGAPVVRAAALALAGSPRPDVAPAALRAFEVPLWLMDEPATHLDVVGCELLRQLIDEHLDAGGIVIAATHQDLGLAPHRLQRLALEEVRAS